MKMSLADQRRFEAEIAELIRTGRMPTLEQVQAAIESTRRKYEPLIREARQRREEQ
jgi:hypothetical protein